MTNNNNTLIPLDKEQVKRIVLTYDAEFCNTLTKTETALEPKKKAKELCKGTLQSFATLQKTASNAVAPNTDPIEDNLVDAKRFKSKAGVLCQQSEHGEQCTKEAEYSINTNFFCPAHFDVEKEVLRKTGKTVCVENTGETA